MTADSDNTSIWKLGRGWLCPPAVNWDCMFKNTTKCQLPPPILNQRIQSSPWNPCPLQRKARIWNRQPWYYLWLWWVIIPKCHPPSNVIFREWENHKRRGITLYQREKKQRGQHWKQAPPETLPLQIVWNTDSRTAPHPQRRGNGQLLEEKNHVPSFFSHLWAHSMETLDWPRSRLMAGMIVLLMCFLENQRGDLFLLK